MKKRGTMKTYKAKSPAQKNKGKSGRKTGTARKTRAGKSMY